MMWQVSTRPERLRTAVAYNPRKMWTAFGIMLGYLSGVAFHNVAGSGNDFTSATNNGTLEFSHACDGEINTPHLLALHCVSGSRATPVRKCD